MKLSKYDIEMTKNWLDKMGYKQVRQSPFSETRMGEIREMAASCLNKSMRDAEASREEMAALCKLGALAMPLDLRVNSDYRFNYGMVRN